MRTFGIRHASIAAAAIGVLAIGGCSAEQEDPPREAPGTAAPGDTGETGAADDGEATGPSDADDPAQTAGPDASAGQGGGPVVDGVEFPAGPEAEQAAWILEHLTGSERLDQNQVVQRFHPDFLSEISGADLEGVLDGVRARGEVGVLWAEIQPTAGGDQLFVGLTVGEEPWVMQVGVAEDQISTLWFGPNDEEETPDLASWEEVEAALDEELAETGGPAGATVLVGEITGGTCEVGYSSPDAEAQPSGSTFKLAVLSAVVDAVEAGELGWDEELTITDEVKSLPSGVLQDEPAGEVVTIEEAAQLMIAISDNTATDMLIDAVGVDAVENVYADLGMDLDRVTPLLTTRQLFELGWGAPEVLQQWQDADSDQRRELVQELTGDLESIDLASIMSTVVWPAGAEYFFTGEELCATMARLQEQAGTGAGEPVREILSLSTFVGQPEDAAFLGFKGGSSTGAEAMVFYAETSEDEPGEGRVLVLQVSDAENPLPDGGRFGVYQAAVNLLVAGD